MEMAKANLAKQIQVGIACGEVRDDCWCMRTRGDGYVMIAKDGHIVLETGEGMDTPDGRCFPVYLDATEIENLIDALQIARASLVKPKKARRP